MAIQACTIDSKQIPAEDRAVNINSAFTDDPSQSVRLLAVVRLPESVNEAHVQARDVDRIASPACHTWNDFFLNGPRASDDFMTERAIQQPCWTTGPQRDGEA